MRQITCARAVPWVEEIGATWLPPPVPAAEPINLTELVCIEREQVEGGRIYYNFSATGTEPTMSCQPRLYVRVPDRNIVVRVYP